VVLVERDLSRPQSDHAGRRDVEGERGPGDDQLTWAIHHLHKVDQHLARAVSDDDVIDADAGVRLGYRLA
jgi:hypothetical protein